MQNACCISYPMVLYFLGNENMGRLKKKKEQLPAYTQT